MLNAQKRFIGSFEGRISVSSSNPTTQQVTLTATPEVAEMLENILISHGITALKEQCGNNISLRINIK